MVISGPERRAGAAPRLLGVCLCVLLALFAIERRIAAYPTHNAAAATIAATGLDKPQRVAAGQPHSIELQLVLAAFVVLLAFPQFRQTFYTTESQKRCVYRLCLTAPLAVRPPPSL